MKLKYFITVFFILSSISGFAQNYEWVVPPVYDSIAPFHCGKAAMKINNKWGYINENGTVIVKPEFDVLYDFNNNAGVATTTDNTIIAIIDENGLITKPVGLYKIDKRFPLFNDGMLLVTDGIKWGFMNKSGKIVIPCKYYYAKPFSEGLAGVVFDDSGWYYINVNNNVVIPPVKNEVRIWVSGFNNGKAFVVKKNGLTCIDLYGNKINVDLPFISPPTDYSKKNLPCNEGEIIIDNQNKVEGVVMKSSKMYRFMTNQPMITKSEGGFSFDGFELPYNKKDIFWNTQSMATIIKEGKAGIISICPTPSLKISLTSEIVNSIFGNDAELKFKIINNLSKDASSLSVKIDGVFLKELPDLSANGSSDLCFNISKKNDLQIENKDIEVSVYSYGLFMAKQKFPIQVKDVPSLKINFPKEEYHVRQGETCSVGFNISNESSVDANNVYMIIKDSDGRQLLSKSIDIMQNDKFSGSFLLKGYVGQNAAPGVTKQVKRVIIILKHPKTPSIQGSKNIGLFVTIPEPPTKNPVDTKTSKQVITN